MGKVIMSGIVPPLVAPITGILASDLAIGSSVYLMENGVATEYLVVNHGKPSGSSLYDDSCDGTWLMRKILYGSRIKYDSTSTNYDSSEINTYLNNTFFNLFGEIEKQTIKQVKIPYINGVDGTGKFVTHYGENGLSAKIFLLSCYEIGFTNSDNKWIGVDGTKLDYFDTGTSNTAVEKRIAQYSSGTGWWWTRSPQTGNSKYVFYVTRNGTLDLFISPDYTAWSRPTLIIPPNALFDTKTLILKGVA